MKIGFFGLNDYGFAILKILFESNNYEIIFATNKSKKVPHVSSIERQFVKYCYDNQISFLGNVNANDTEIINLAAKTDLCIIGGYDRILKNPIIKAPKRGIINTHLGLIPENRGCNPTMWAILEDIPQGFTTYYLNENIDHGEIISRVSDKTLVNMTSKDVYDRLTQLAIEDFPFTLEKIKKNQSLGIPDSKGRYFKQGLPNNGYISFTWEKNYIKKFSDALWFPPYEPAKIIIENKTYYVRVNKIKDNNMDCELMDENPNI